MLALRPGCECCDADLYPDQPGALVCSYECTWCSACAEHLGGVCPNCGGDLSPRPTRTGQSLLDDPASTARVVREQPCPRETQATPLAHTEATFPAQRVNRHKERAATTRDELYAVLDDALVATLSTVVDGRPWVVPMLFARDGDRLLVHGSSGAGALRQVAAGAPAALSVAHLDGLVVGHTTFESSANYRSAVVYGVLEPVTGAENERSLDILSDRIIPGRVSEVRPSTRRERAATATLALRILDGQWTVKTRNAWSDEPGEPTDAWIGVVDRVQSWAAPRTAPFSPTQEVPASVRTLVGAVHGAIAPAEGAR